MVKGILPYWVALYLAPGIRAKQHRIITEYCPNLQELFQLAAADLQALGLAEVTIQYIQQPDWALVEAQLQWAEHDERHLLTRQDAAYPELLRQIPDPPPLLFVQGRMELLSSPQLAIVGSRNPTPQGKHHAQQFAKFMAEQDFVVTSGLALGIDGLAHQAALDCHGSTIAVLGTGIDRVYPQRHQSLAEKIMQQGLLVSEFPLGTGPNRTHFPQRNRLISGLSRGVLVVEAAIRSGSLITARFAMEQNREVFAIPGSVQNPLARGCHQLLQQGAKLVETGEDILEELGQECRRHVSPQAKSSAGLAKTCTKMLKYVDFAPTSVDSIIQQSGLTAREVSSMLLSLEMAGYITSQDGAYYRCP